MLLIIGILILVGILGFVIYKSATNKIEVSAEPTPFDNLTAPTEPVETPTPLASPSGTPKAAVDRSQVEIQVQNGTGISGEAAYLQNQLKTLGYTDVKVGNAGDQNATTTTVTFSTTLDQSVVTEITQKLNALYQTVTTKTSASQTFDVVIVTGLRKGSTPKPSTAPSASPSGTPRPSTSPTPTPSPTST